MKYSKYKLVNSNIITLSGSQMTRNEFIHEMKSELTGALNYETRLTVIIPAFNVKNYIKASIDSIACNAQYLNLFLVIVDDGSTDRTDERASEILSTVRFPYAIVQTDNHGLSAARNLALDFTITPYVSFLDADDYVNPKSLHKIVNIAMFTKADQVLAKANVFDEKTGEVFRFYDHWAFDKLLSGRRIAQCHYRINSDLLCIEPNVCTRIWSVDFLNRKKLRFPEGRLFEDIGFHLLSILESSVIIAVDIEFFFYRVGRPGKITSDRSIRRIDAIDTINDFLDSIDLEALPRSSSISIMYSIERMLEWGSTMIGFQFKNEYRSKQARLYLKFPDPILKFALSQKWMRKVAIRIIKIRFLHGKSLPSLAIVRKLSSIKLKRFHKKSA